MTVRTMPKPAIHLLTTVVGVPYREAALVTFWSLLRRATFPVVWHVIAEKDGWSWRAKVEQMFAFFHQTIVWVDSAAVAFPENMPKEPKFIRWAYLYSGFPESRAVVLDADCFVTGDILKYVIPDDDVTLRTMVYRNDKQRKMHNAMFSQVNVELFRKVRWEDVDIKPVAVGYDGPPRKSDEAWLGRQPGLSFAVFDPRNIFSITEHQDHGAWITKTVDRPLRQSRIGAEKAEILRRSENIRKPVHILMSYDNRMYWAGVSNILWNFQHATGKINLHIIVENNYDSRPIEAICKVFGHTLTRYSVDVLKEWKIDKWHRWKGCYHLYAKLVFPWVRPDIDDYLYCDTDVVAWDDLQSVLSWPMPTDIMGRLTGVVREKRWHGVIAPNGGFIRFNAKSIRAKLTFDQLINGQQKDSWTDEFILGERVREGKITLTLNVGNWGVLWCSGGKEKEIAHLIGNKFKWWNRVRSDPEPAVRKPWQLWSQMHRPMRYLAAVIRDDRDCARIESLMREIAEKTPTMVIWHLFTGSASHKERLMAVLEETGLAARFHIDNPGEPLSTDGVPYAIFKRVPVPDTVGWVTVSADFDDVASYLRSPDIDYGNVYCRGKLIACRPASFNLKQLRNFRRAKKTGSIADFWRTLVRADLSFLPSLPQSKNDSPYYNPGLAMARHAVWAYIPGTKTHERPEYEI